MNYSGYLKQLALGMLVAAAGIAATHAAIVTVPAGLNPGDTYRLVFVSNAGDNISGASSNMGVYDALVTSQAMAVPELNLLGTTWQAIASVNGLDARDHTNTNPFVDGAGVPIFGLDGTRIVDDNNDLWDGTLDTSIRFTPSMTEAFGFSIWTGTDTSGVGIPNLRLGDSNAQIGSSAETDGTWMQWFTGGTGVTRHLYGMSGELTVAPEPSSSLLVILGGFAGILRRRRGDL